jgi:ABC-type Mn2+/Zn2+ transport system permease subunit
MGIGIFSSVVGVVISYHLAIPVGPSVALTCSFLIFISFIYKSVTSTPLFTKASDARVSVEA